MSAKPLRTLITVVMDIFVVFAVALVIGLVVKFFGALADAEWGQVIVRITEAVSVPIGVADIATPYGGYFDVEMSATVVLLLLVEWLLSIAKRQA